MPECIFAILGWLLVLTLLSRSAVMSRELFIPPEWFCTEDMFKLFVVVEEVNGGNFTELV